MKSLMIELLEIMLWLIMLLYFSKAKSHGLLYECHRLNQNRCRSDVTQRPLGIQQMIHFGLMLDFPDSQQRPSSPTLWSADGYDIAPAVYLAVEQVNNRSDLLKGYNIEISRFDSGCDDTLRTALGINDLVCRCEPIVGVIGPSCEKSSTTVSQLTNKIEFSMITINYGGDGSSVGNHNFSFGILGPNSYSQAIVHLIKHFNWTNSALLYTPGYLTILRELFAISDSQDSGLFKFISAIYNTHLPLQEVKESFSKIIIILAPPPTVLRTLCLAYHMGMVFPMYQWIFLEETDQNFHEISFTYDKEFYHCSDPEISISLSGTVNFFLNTFENIPTNTDARVSLEEYIEQYESQRKVFSRQFGVMSHFTPWARGFYDAVWVLAFALNDSLVDLNISLSMIKPGSPVLAETIRKHMLNLDIRGIIGDIKLDMFGYNKKIKGVLNIYQYQGKNRRRVAIYEEEEIKFLLPNASLNFINDSFNKHFVQIDTGVAGGVSLFTAFSLMLVILAQVLNIYYRNHKIIKASSPALNHLVFVGCYVIIVGIVFHMLENLEQFQQI